jgi:hypothetical protein
MSTGGGWTTGFAVTLMVIVQTAEVSAPSSALNGI